MNLKLDFNLDLPTVYFLFNFLLENYHLFL